jgi:modulator of FtsH protease HflK
MPWNQPNGPNNPWGRRPGQSGGPDLDERLKSWQRRLESLWRGGGEGNSLLMVAILVVIALWLVSGFYQVNLPERGVIQRFGRLVLPVRNPGIGWRLPWPIETVTRVNVVSVNSSDFKSRVLTSDVFLVDLTYSVQYQFTDPVKKLFKVKDPDGTLNEVSESAIREVVGRSTLDDVLVGNTRPEITRRAKELIQRVLDNYDSGITVSTVNLKDVQVPDAVIPSQRDANKAQAEREQKILAAEAYANGILPKAQGTASRIQQQAQAYKAQVVALAEGQAARFSQQQVAYAQAPDVTRRRMYIETIEDVLQRAHKVLIDGHAGNNMLYLPIDKLLDKMGAAGIESAEPSAGSASKEQTPSVTVEARGRGER